MSTTNGGHDMHCTHCGTKAVENGAYCHACGAALVQDAGTVVNPASEIGPRSEPVVINGVTFTPGEGQFEGLYAAPGGPWVQIRDGRIIRVRSAGTVSRSTSRTVGGIVLLVVAGFAALQGWSWFSGYTDLEADGNMFAGTLVPLFLGAFAVAAGFGVWGMLLLNGNKK